MSSKVKVSLVVAMCQNRGIGLDGQLPWRLKGDMAFFRAITSSAPSQDGNRRNAVVMGRKTWDSIPAKFRPLRNRLNVVISASLTSPPEGALLARSLQDAMTTLEQGHADTLAQVFIIGGASVYGEAVAGGLADRIYLTRVQADLRCDTFLPEFDLDRYKLVADPGPLVPRGDVTEDGLTYNFEVYDRV